MPEQKPICCIISMSKLVRMRSRWASSSFPSRSKTVRRSSSSCWMVPMARRITSVSAT
ncbi:hypothetical protein BC477_13285 [Clavibacter michiganensis subsp. michiganensis]|uniref:Uncharacterized protein n=1 Tax=Clavibacter michiganensis subsp. michiganensis TaxID=33013 RepID=A0A251XIC8_CLAMM|nr:hypothetical protein BC477_13285 [Clavibacter michiganensis subsp. michiganensis]OUE02769.1 hypothetical protein CMMCAS07_12190 [Clavibacter michiganensis subsp. michiganensis]